MTFRELLEKYKNGTATEAERALVEAELEKSEAIADYLAEGLEALEEGGEALSHSDAEVKKVKRTVNRRLRRTALWAASIVLAAVLAVQFVINPLVVSFYYQPNGRTVGQDEERDSEAAMLYNVGDDVEVDLTALYELLVPGQTPADIQVDEEGFGRYTLTYQTVDGLTGDMLPVTQKLRPDSYGKQVQRGWENYKLNWLDYTAPASPEESTFNRQIEYLSQLPETSFITAWVHFPEDLTCVQFAKLAESYDLDNSNRISFRWAGVRVSDPIEAIGGQSHFLGLIPEEAAREQARVSPAWETYPLFDYHQYFAENGYNSIGNNRSANSGYQMETHFQSVLAYAADRPEAVEALVGPIREGILWDFAAAQSYVEEHGVRIGGALVYAEPKVLLRMWERGEIDGLSLEDVLPSRYSARAEFQR
nr:anti sigma factor C-terminal domain-containing protein [uncultured Flavonifractor sp.]